MSNRSDVTILIVEADWKSAEHLTSCLENLGYKIVGICDDGRDAIQSTANLKPTLALIDIALSGSIDGIDVAHIIEERFHTPVIFLTSVSDFKSTESIKNMQPAGYIVRPYSNRDLESGIEIALHNHKSKQQKINTADESLFIKENHRYKKVDFKNIKYIKANDNYTLIQTETEQITSSVPLKNIEEKLAHKGFMRVHRSFIVNIKKIDLINSKHLMIGEEEIPLSENYRDLLLSKLNLL